MWRIFHTCHTRAHTLHTCRTCHTWHIYHKWLACHTGHTHATHAMHDMHDTSRMTYMAHMTCMTYMTHMPRMSHVTRLTYTTLTSISNLNNPDIKQSAKRWFQLACCCINSILSSSWSKNIQNMICNFSLMFPFAMMWHYFIIITVRYRIAPPPTRLVSAYELSGKYDREGELAVKFLRPRSRRPAIKDDDKNQSLEGVLLTNWWAIKFAEFGATVAAKWKMHDQHWKLLGKAAAELPPSSATASQFSQLLHG